MPRLDENGQNEIVTQININYSSEDVSTINERMLRNSLKNPKKSEILILYLEVIHFFFLLTNFETNPFLEVILKMIIFL